MQQKTFHECFLNIFGFQSTAEPISEPSLVSTKRNIKLFIFLFNSRVINSNKNRIGLNWTGRQIALSLFHAGSRNYSHTLYYKRPIQLSLRTRTNLDRGSRVGLCVSRIFLREFSPGRIVKSLKFLLRLRPESQLFLSVKCNQYFVELFPTRSKWFSFKNSHKFVKSWRVSTEWKKWGGWKFKVERTFLLKSHP